MTDSSANVTLSDTVLTHSSEAPRAGRSQAILLLLASCLPVLGIVLIAPVQPRIAEAFSENGSVDFLVPMMITAPALAIAVFSPFAGALADRWGRKRLLIGSMFIYGFFGTAPLWLNSLEFIVLSRVGLGVAEAIIITVSTTLIADYFRGAERQKYLGYQVFVTTVAGTVFLALGGILGGIGWRTPFWLYTVSIVFAVAMTFMLWEPAHDRTASGSRVPWKSIGAPLCVTVFGGMVFYVLIVYLPFLLTAQGISSPEQIGLIAAATSMATASGAFAFRFIARLGLRVLLATAFGTAAVGLLAVWGAGESILVLVAGAIVTSFGTGVLVPSLLTWAVSKLAPARLGIGTGAWQSALFLGQFLTPLVVGTLVAVSQNLQQSVGLFGLAAAAATACSLLLYRSRPSTGSAESPS